MQVRSLGWEDPLEEGMATYCSILAWRISWTEEPGGPQPIVWQRRRHDCSDLACTRAQMLAHRDLGASLATELGCVTFTVWLCSHTQRLLDPQTTGIFMEASSHQIRSDQISRSVLSDSLEPMNCSTPGLPVHHQLPEFTQTHVHRVSDAIQPLILVPFSSCPQSRPASESFPMSQLFA